MCDDEVAALVVDNGAYPYGLHPDSLYLRTCGDNFGISWIIHTTLRITILHLVHAMEGKPPAIDTK